MEVIMLAGIVAIVIAIGFGGAVGTAHPDSRWVASQSE